MFALIYKLLPAARIALSDVWVGAIITALLFSLGKFLIGLYLGRSAISSSFGAAGTFIALMVWIYYSAQIFLLGAEFTYIYAQDFGSASKKPSNGTALPNKKAEGIASAR
jgi:membrane protein